MIMYPCKIQPIQKDNLYNVICTSQDGEIIYLNENTHITIHRKKIITRAVDATPPPVVPVDKPIPMPGITMMDVEVSQALPKKALAFGDKIPCDNPKCPWPEDFHFKKDMTEYADKFFCTLDCAKEFRGESKFNKVTDDKPDSEGTNENAQPWHPKYDACVECHSTKRNYVAKGLCTTCYFKKR